MSFTCCIKYCKSGLPGFKKSHTRISFHALPKNPVLLKKWKQHVPSDVKFTNLTKICSLHFLDSDFINVKSSKRKTKNNVKQHRKLNPNSYPTLFLVVK